MPDMMTQQPMGRAGKGGDSSDPYSLGAAAYQARNYDEATKQFDRAAKTGDRNAELWAAESVRAGQGCAMALGRFETLATKDAGNYVGNEASLRAAKCQIGMGNTDAARTRLASLQQTSTHGQVAKETMADMDKAIAAKQQGAGAGVHAAASPKKAAAPARPAPARPSEAAEKQQQRSMDKQNAGF